MNNLTRNWLSDFCLYARFTLKLLWGYINNAPRTGSPSFNQIRQSGACEISSFHDVSLVHSSSSMTAAICGTAYSEFVLKKKKSNKKRAKCCVASNKLQTNHFFLAAVEGTRWQWNARIADFIICVLVQRVKNKNQSIRNKFTTNTTTLVKTTVYGIRILLYCSLFKIKWILVDNVDVK